MHDMLCDSSSSIWSLYFLTKPTWILLFIVQSFTLQMMQFCIPGWHSICVLNPSTVVTNFEHQYSKEYKDKAGDPHPDGILHCVICLWLWSLVLDKDSREEQIYLWMIRYQNPWTDSMSKNSYLSLVWTCFAMQWCSQKLLGRRERIQLITYLRELSVFVWVKHSHSLCFSCPVIAYQANHIMSNDSV